MEKIKFDFEKFNKQHQNSPNYTWLKKEVETIVENIQEYLDDGYDDTAIIVEEIIDIEFIYDDDAWKLIREYSNVLSPISIRKAKKDLLVDILDCIILGCIK